MQRGCDADKVSDETKVARIQLNLDEISDWYLGQSRPELLRDKIRRL